MVQEDSNFRVYVRCRNNGPVGDSQGLKSYVPVSSKEILRKTTPPKKYRFDRVFDENTDQQTIFKECAEPLIGEFMRGYNGTLFAYGQTGTGKTYTVTGKCAPSSISEEAGIVPRVLESVFEKLESSKAQDWLLELKYVELYNEELRDLLNVNSFPPHQKSRSSSITSHAKPLRIIENRNSRSTEVVGAISTPVSNLDSALSVVKEASSRRQTAATQLNADSSRSHAILTLILVTREPVSGMAVRSKLHLVDLAGSENVAKSGAVRMRAQEAGEINKSLLSLGRVIEMLVSTEQCNTQTSSNTTNNTVPVTRRSSGNMNNSTSKPYVSYRESKLTHLLQDSLGGSTKTCMVATISLSPINSEESKSTLEYASRAKSIRNQTQTEVEVMDMQVTLKGLSARLEEVQQELIMQRSRDGGVYVSNQNYYQLKSSQRKHAELLAQKETAVKHHELEIEELQKHNAALQLESDKLRANMSMLEDKATQYQALTKSHSQVVESTECINNMLNRYTGKVDSMTTSINQTLKDLPTTFELMKTQLQEFLASGMHMDDLINLAKGNTITASNDYRAKLKEAIKLIVTEMDEKVQAVLAAIVDSMNGTMKGVFDDMDDIQDICIKLRRHIDSMQADIAIRQQSSTETLRLARMLKAHDQQYIETMNKLAEERNALITDMLNKQEQSNKPRLPTSGSGALDLIKTLGSVVSKRPEKVNVDHFINEAYPSNSVHLDTKKIDDTVDNEFNGLNTKLDEAISNAVGSYDSKTVSAEKQKLKSINDNLDVCMQTIQYQGSTRTDKNHIDELKESIQKELHRLQSSQIYQDCDFLQHNAINGSKLTQSPIRRSPSKIRNALRIQRESPTKSPSKFDRRGVTQATLRSPLKERNPPNTILQGNDKVTLDAKRKHPDMNYQFSRPSRFDANKKTSLKLKSIVAPPSKRTRPNI